MPRVYYSIDRDPLVAQWSFDQDRLANHKPAVCPGRPLLLTTAPGLLTSQHSEFSSNSCDPNHAFDEATTHHAVVDLHPISPWARAARAPVLHHHSPPIRHQVCGAHALDRVPRAKDREPGAGRAAPGAKQEGNLVQESASPAGGHDGSPL